jgi:Mg-chelatase subunit ChlD
VISVIPPVGELRVPSDIVIVVDVSGSMGNEASATGVESSGLNILDIVKHAVKTIINVLNDHDRLSVISYSDNAATIFDLTAMDAAGKANALRLTSLLEPGGMTNLWDGLHTGMEVFTLALHSCYGSSLCS